MMTRKFPIILSLVVLFCALGSAEDTFTPYTSGEEVPTNVVDLWKDVDARADKLETEVVKEWKEDGVVTRYVIFKVGTFKGEDARIAAFYTFPEGAEAAPAFVWAHGGGQRADRERGTYFAKQGYATIDVNWGGREIVEGIEKNTDWGAIDPSQGPKFYPGALRKGTKLDLLPDEHTIDPVVSPRNGNWFMLAYAGRRAITFLEEQPEVDPEKIGFTGYSMGGNITSYVAINPRLKAVVPMVGGAGFTTEDFPGLPGTGRKYHDHTDLFAATMDSQSYYPHVKCPVLLLSATNDFHSTFENIYRCMNLLPHDEWRVSQNLHFSHNLGPEQWILTNLWFDKYLKAKPVSIPKTADSELVIDGEKSTATFSATPDQSGRRVSGVEIYYSHDPNPKSRFWILADSEEEAGTWTAELKVRDELPLFVFANCTYPLDEPAESFGRTAESFTITSDEGVHYPEKIDAGKLRTEAKPMPVFADFGANGFEGWALSGQGGLSTYKFQDPRMETPEADAKLRIRVAVPRKRMSYRFRITKNKYITGVHEPQAGYSFSKNFDELGDQELILSASDFKTSDKEAMTDWSNISTFAISIYDGEAGSDLYFIDEANRHLFKKLEWSK